MKFIHCSDIHLGKTFNDSRERYKDYFTALSAVINLTLEEKADFLLIAGDLFHEGSIAPSIMSDAMDALQPLKDKGIPIIAIEGNHDMFRRRRDESWLHFLSRQEYIKLLRPQIDPQAGKIEFPHYDAENAVGGWINQNDHTIYGIGYYGAITGRMLELTLESLPERADIGIFHGGVWDNNIITIGRVTTEEIMPLKERFGYVALGHGHRPYQVENFAFNPGALEIVNREEAGAKGSENGTACLVEIKGKEVITQTLKIPRRKFIDLKIDIDDSQSTDEAVIKIKDAFIKEAANLSNGCRPVLFADIRGRTVFDAFEIDIKQIQDEADRILNPITTTISNQASKFLISAQSGSGKDLDTLFRETILDLVKTENIGRQDPEAVLNLIFELKKSVIDDKETDPGQLMDLIHGRMDSILGRKKNLNE